MNEELKIIIRAVTDEARKNMAAVREELEAIEDEAQDSGKQVDAAMQQIGKGALAAIAAITALTGAMAALGKSAQEVQKGFDKLNTTFLNAGSTTAQASETYKELFSFLGDHDRAIETAQSLALITNEEEKLAQWSNILQGAFAEMGDKLPIEGLAEAANETINVGQVTGVLADALNWAGVSEDAFNASLAQTNSLSEREALVRNTLNGLYSNSAKLYDLNSQATKQYNEAQANLNISLAQASGYTTPLLTSLANLSSTLLTALAPALQTVAMYLTAFIQLMAEAVTWVGSFFGLFSSSGDTVTADVEGYKKAVTDYQNSLRNSFKGTNGELDKNLQKINAVKKATMGFDELNIVSSQTSASTGSAIGGGGGVGAIPTAPNPADYGIGTSSIDFSQFTEGLKEAKKELQGIGVLIGIIALGIGAWKLTNFISEIKEAYRVWNTPIKLLGKDWAKQVEDAEVLQHKIRDMIGYLMIAAGAILLIKGYSDAWANGIDWENFALILGGIGLIVGGLVLSFGPMAGAIGLIAGGVAMLVLGIKDLVTNGYSMEGVLMVLAGVLAVGIGLVWAFNAALLANPITWIIAAILALVAVFVILWNECDWFREFWIGLWEGSKAVFTAVWDWLKTFFTETIPNIFNTVINFVKDNWQGLLLLIVNPFAGAFKLLYDNCDGFRNFIDKWVGKIKGFFKDLVNGIKNTFSGIGSWFTNIFTKIGDTIGDKVSGAVKGAINGVLSSAVKIINGFIKAINLAIDIINAIPGVDIKKLNTLSVPKLAKGGIVDSATLAMIGENGKEAVIPLENNTGWIDTLADKLAARSNTPSKIVLQLDGKELGWATINSMNDITRQTGALQLAII